MRAAAILTFDNAYPRGRLRANNCKTALSLHVVESASDDTTSSLILDGVVNIKRKDAIWKPGSVSHLYVLLCYLLLNVMPSSIFINDGDDGDDDDVTYFQFRLPRLLFCLSFIHLYVMVSS